MRVRILLEHPKTTGTVLAFISLLAGVAALLAADFGAAGWVFVPLLLWLVTVGLPTTAAALLSAAVWGTVSPLHGLGLYGIVATALAVVSQVFFVKGIAYLAGGGHEN